MACGWQGLLVQRTDRIFDFTRFNGKEKKTMERGGVEGGITESKGIKAIPCC